MLTDPYANAISTSSADARDHYDRDVQLFLAADYGTTEAFSASVLADPAFALGHAGLARALKMEARRTLNLCRPVLGTATPVQGWH